MTYHSTHAKRGIFSALAAVALAVAAGNAQAVTLDFNGQATGPFSSITEQGYNFNFIGFGDLQAVRNIGGGDLALFDSNIIGTIGAGVVVSRVGGGVFDLISFDLLNFGDVPTTNNSGVEITVAGTLYTPAVGSTTISPNITGITSFNINIVSNDEAGLGTTRVADYGIDNIVLQLTPPPPPPPTNGVPEPITATLGLMGLGVLGMATRRRAV